MTSAGRNEISAVSPQVSNTDDSLLLNKTYHKIFLTVTVCYVMSLLVSLQLSAERKVHGPTGHQVTVPGS